MSADAERTQEAADHQVVCLSMPPGSLLSEQLVAAGEGIALPCNGRGSCGKCRAVVSGALAPPNETELQHLSPEDLAAGVRLACQARSTGGEVLVHSVPKASDFAILVEGYGQVPARDANLQVSRVVLPPAVPDSLSEWNRLSLASDGVLNNQEPSLSVLRMVPTALDSGSQELELARFADHLVSVRPARKRNRYYGVAFDIGTTTLVAYLVNLRSGQVVGALPRANPQAAHGADVMSRISYSGTPGGLERLHTEITSAVADMASSLAASRGLSLQEIAVIGAVGNTCMHHLLLGIPTARLGQSPYLPVHRTELLTPASQLQLAGFANTLVWTGPIIGGFVGADAVAAAVAGQLLADEKPRLLIDLGTNGEILLAAKGRLLACSAAAGPALEGVQISCGMRAEPGAIDGVTLTRGDVELHLLGTAVEPRGICGSGLIDAVAELLRMGVIDETGRFNSPGEVGGKGHKALAKRLVQTEQGWAFRLTEGSRPVDLTQADIREVQLAKGAIRAAVEICCLEMGIATGDISQVMLAGAFGTYIRKDNAMRIGLLPPLPLRRVRSIGNAAGAGAVLAITSRAARAAGVDLARRAEHVDLGGQLTFQERFVDAMLFDQA